MKYVMQHPTTREKITNWTQGLGRQLLWGSFYFWNAGSPIQRSQEGLLRTLLSQFLEQAPDIAYRICPQRWALCKTLGSGSMGRAPEWQWKELMETFSLLSLLLGDRFNLVLLIDGLDEFEGNHESLVDFIKVVHSGNGTKICVSSRPWNVFSDAFRDSRNLKMEQVTAEDICKYVEGTFENTLAFHSWKKTFPNQTEKLMSDIVTKAQGVFLWVSIVVNQLRIGLIEGDKLSDLQAIIDDIPSDLSSLYDNIWRRIKPSYIRNTSQIFQIHQCALDSDERMDAFLLYLADEDQNALEEDIDNLLETRKKYVSEVIRRRLDSRTRGLLEIADDGYINYLHRTVRDWIEPMWPEICSHTPSHFDPQLAILKALTIYCSASEQWSGATSTDTIVTKIWLIVFRCLSHAIRVQEHLQKLDTLIQLLDRLDLETTKIWNAHCEAPTRGQDRRFTLRRAPRLGTNYSEQSSDGNPRENSWTVPLPSTQHMARPLGADMHWSQTQFSSFRSSANRMEFINLAAQVGLSLYVKSKCRANPELLSPTRASPSILACAVLGFRHFCSDIGTESRFERLLDDSMTYQGRADIIKFILLEAAPGHSGGAKAQLKEIGTLIQQIRMRSDWGGNDENGNFWKTVLELLERGPKRTGRQSWKKEATSWLSGVLKKDQVGG